VGFVVGDDGVVVIDTFQDPEPAADLLAHSKDHEPADTVRGQHALPLDHVNGNDVFAARARSSLHTGTRAAGYALKNIKMIDPPVTAEKKAAFNPSRCQTWCTTRASIFI